MPAAAAPGCPSTPPPTVALIPGSARAPAAAVAPAAAAASAAAGAVWRRVGKLARSGSAAAKVAHVRSPTARLGLEAQKA